MEKCFVIQPFDNGKFDSRFEDTFKPAIKNAGFEPYRVDNDWSVQVPIDDIERGIRESEIVFAEISTDNPNVWYELGYAYACGKDVVMVCSEERTGKFPFDIQHKSIITYKTTTKSDYLKLEESIEKKLAAIKQKVSTTEKLHNTPIRETEGLQGHEIAILILLASNQLTSEDSMPVYSLKTEMNKAGYNDIGTSVGLKMLNKKGFIKTSTEADYNNNIYSVLQLSDAGEEWIIANQDMFSFRLENIPQKGHNNSTPEELPF